MPTPNESLNQAFEDAVAALLPSIPYLMHGAGDVPPDQVDPATANLVTRLTVQYMAKLCDAAVDAHEILRDNKYFYHPSNKRSNDKNSTVTPCLPPPALNRSRQPPKPPREKQGLPQSSKPTAPADGTASLQLQLEEELEPRKRKRRAQDEYWDEPLPEPKIRNAKQTSTGSTAAPQQLAGEVDDSDPAPAESTHVDDWVGLAGVDFLEYRARTAYVQGPAVLSTQSFLFPICHDVYTYGRVRQLQKARRRVVLPLLMNPVFNDLIQQEGKQEHAHVSARKKGGSSGSATADASDPEEADEDEQDDEVAADEEDLPFWPGLDDIVPAHRK